MARIKYWNETSQSWEYADKSLQINNNLLIDPTLSIEGRAADAKAVGEAISNKLDDSELSTAIDTALAQAKASGEFDGADGKDGVDGKTPVKGTDYYTEADKTEMVNAVLAALPTWTGGSY